MGRQGRRGRWRDAGTSPALLMVAHRLALWSGWVYGWGHPCRNGRQLGVYGIVTRYVHIIHLGK